MCNVECKYLEVGRPSCATGSAPFLISAPNESPTTGAALAVRNIVHFGQDALVCICVRVVITRSSVICALDADSICIATTASRKDCALLLGF